MAAYRLYCFAQSGNAYKAALMLNLCGADWEPRFVDFFNGETRTPEFRQINEMGEVPVLENEGRRWSQSGVILDQLANELQRFGWADEDERREILRWLLWDNHKLTSYIGCGEPVEMSEGRNSECRGINGLDVPDNRRCFFSTDQAQEAAEACKR